MFCLSLYAESIQYTGTCIFVIQLPRCLCEHMQCELGTHNCTVVLVRLFTAASSLAYFWLLMHLQSASDQAYGHVWVIALYGPCSTDAL